MFVFLFAFFGYTVTDHSFISWSLTTLSLTPGHELCGEGSGAHGTVCWSSGLLHQGGLPGHGGRRGQHCGGQLVVCLWHHPQGVLHARPSSLPPSTSICIHLIFHLYPVLFLPLHVTTTVEVCPSYVVPCYSSFHFSSVIFCGSRQKIPLACSLEQKIGENSLCKRISTGTQGTLMCQELLTLVSTMTSTKTTE